MSHAHNFILDFDGKITCSICGILEDKIDNNLSDLKELNINNNESSIESSNIDILSFDKSLAEKDEKINELTSDIKKIQADFINYKKRIERDSQTIYLNVKSDLILVILPLLDDLYRISLHDKEEPLTLSLKNHLDSIIKEYNLTVYGSIGEEFDPLYHEAIAFKDDESYQTPTITAIYQPGYRIDNKIIRTAMVEVSSKKN